MAENVSIPMRDRVDRTDALAGIEASRSSLGLIPMSLAT